MFENKSEPVKKLFTEIYNSVAELISENIVGMTDDEIEEYTESIIETTDEYLRGRTKFTSEDLPEFMDILRGVKNDD